MLRKEIAINLKECRKRLRLSQHRVAEQCGMAQKAICKIENYVENIGVDTLDKLCRGLGIHPYELVTKTDEISAKDLLEKNIFFVGVIQLLYQYSLIMSEITDKDVVKEPIDTYGIKLEKPAAMCIKDISTDKNFVQGLVELCNRFQVDPIQLNDVIDDALFEMNM